MHRKPHGELDGSTLQWLDATLASSSDRPALLFLHHPPFKAGIWHMDRQNLLNASDLAPIVRRHPRVQLIATGHVHRATLTMFAGVPTSDCWQPGQILLINAKVKSRDEQRLGIGVTSARRWAEGESLEDLPSPEPCRRSRSG